ncbi:hypothetical protein HMPREF0658_1954 [Hoylesella marshii DSM 16973 = JCM 13450]|uniref:Uncharacterized protein n=1 Tax=Hoylesella marshii DSM 16973 = JCM 13450 TaxID=862515 RepID=E0NUU9_9BACT|nr:hypothetical protein HMPREF0658_1954 [Hoylesella marshii DSM 16973 = JCM 13450]
MYIFHSANIRNYFSSSKHFERKITILYEKAYKIAENYIQSA